MSHRDNQHRFSNVPALAAAAALVAANICLLGPWEIYLPNQAELDSTFREILPLLLVYGLGLTLLVTGVGLLLPRRARRVYTAAVLAVGILLWVQGSFLKWGYGELDGRGIDWSRFHWQGWVDGVIWTVVIVAAGAAHKRVVRHALFIALGFVALQSAFAIIRARSQPAPAVRTSRAEHDATLPDAIAGLSHESNVFHIIMDGFQTDVFMELVEEEGFADKLDGFVVYTDNLAVGKRTVLCVPAIFSGEIYDGTVEESEYFRAAIQRSFHNVLFDNGYVVNLMPHITMENTKHTNYFTSPATYATAPRTRLLRTSSYLVDVSLFRQLPHFAKRFVFNDENWRLSSLVGTPPTHASFQQKAFFRDYIARMHVVHHRPTYTFMHLMPPHPPFVTTADGRYAGRALPNTRENYKNEARAILRMFMDFIARLEALGIYQSSIIVLQGDHGAGFVPPQAGAASSRLASRVSALLAVKASEERGPLRTSTAPSTIADIPATLMDMLAIEHPYPGQSLRRLDERAQRDREVVFMTDRSSSTPVMHKWMVLGAVQDTASWHELPSVAVERKVRHYEWGQSLGFGITGTGEPYLSDGWSTTSPTVHWNDGPTAALTFGITPPERNVAMRFVFFPHIVPGRVDSQRIIMKINGLDVGSVTATENRSLNLDITVRRDVLQSDRMVVSFEFPDAVSPLEIGEGRDPRKLAMGIYSFETHLVGGEPGR